MPRLEEEKAEIENLMSSGTLSSQELQEKGLRMQQIIEELEEKEMRWLELSEKV